MNKPMEKGLVPELRFPEFKNEKRWQVVLLSDICDVKGGKRIPKGHSLIQDGTGGHPYIRVTDMYMGGVDPSSVLFITKEIEQLIKNYKISKNDLFITVAGTIGIVGEIPDELDNANLTENANKIIVKDVNKKYLLQYLSSDKLQNKIKSSITNNAQPKLSLERIRGFCIPLPTPVEQQKIADCLSSLDELVSAHTQKLDALKAHKKGLMQQLLPAEGETVPKQRFPEFENQAPWKKRSFSKLFEIGGGKDHKHLPSGNIPVYGSGGYMRSVNEFLYDGESACIGRKGTINKPMLLKGKFWTVDTLFYTHSFNGCTAKFIYLLFQNIDWLSLNEAGGVPSLSKIIINKIEVMIPEIKEQDIITDCIDSLEELITAQSQKVEALKTHKQGLMQQLFPILIGESNAT